MKEGLDRLPGTLFNTSGGSSGGPGGGTGLKASSPITSKGE